MLLLETDDELLDEIELVDELLWLLVLDELIELVDELDRVLKLLWLESVDVLEDERLDCELSVDVELLERLEALDWVLADKLDCDD